jgi:hypothetical protein
MKHDGFTWDDKHIYFKGKKYPKKLFLQGKGPWEGPAYRNEIKAT